MPEKDTSFRVRIKSEYKQLLVQAALASGSDDFSEWARKVLLREANKILNTSSL